MAGRAWPASGDIRLRAERLDQFAFGQRVFAGASPAEMPDVFVAVRAFRRYRMLMVTLERIGIRKPATYAAAARLASRMSPPDPAREFVAIAQFQGALALLERMRMVGSLDAGKAEALVNSLLAVPLNSSSQYLGGVLRWIAEELRPALPPGDTSGSGRAGGARGPGRHDRRAENRMGRAAVPRRPRGSRTAAAGTRAGKTGRRDAGSRARAGVRGARRSRRRRRRSTPFRE